MNIPPITFINDVHIPDLETFHDHLLAMATQVVEAGDEFPSPTLFVLSNEGKLAVLPPLPSKNMSASYQQGVVEHPMVRACALVFEAWVSTYAKDVDRTKVPMPSEDPNRKEVLCVSIMTKGRQALTYSDIERPSNTVKKTPFTWLDQAEGKHKGRFIR
jgi:hypothetical protein